MLELLLARLLLRRTCILLVVEAAEVGHLEEVETVQRLVDWEGTPGLLLGSIQLNSFVHRVDSILNVGTDITRLLPETLQIGLSRCLEVSVFGGPLPRIALLLLLLLDNDV